MATDKVPVVKMDSLNTEVRMDSLSADDQTQDLRDSRTNLAMRRASFKRSPAVEHRRTRSEVRRKWKRAIKKQQTIIAIRGKQPITRPFISANQATSSKRRGLVPDIPMPFFNPKLNFQKACKMFPDLTVSF